MKRSAKDKKILHEQGKHLGVQKQKAMRTLKDKEKVLYAPFSNIGALNFEKTTGYITIPDKQVIYTRVDEEEDGGDAPTGNEGQKMMWNLQDLDDQIDAEKIEAPELLAGFDVVLEEKRSKRRLYNPGEEDFEGLKEPTDAFEAHEKERKQILFREREVDNLTSLIYGNSDDPNMDLESEDLVDSNRYDVDPEKL